MDTICDGLQEQDRMKISSERRRFIEVDQAIEVVRPEVFFPNAVIRKKRWMTWRFLKLKQDPGWGSSPKTAPGLSTVSPAGRTPSHGDGSMYSQKTMGPLTVAPRRVCLGWKGVRTGVRPASLPACRRGARRSQADKQNRGTIPMPTFMCRKAVGL